MSTIWIEGEDSKHILECKEKGAQQICMQGLDAFDLKLVAEGISPDDRYTMITGIRRWKVAHATATDHHITCTDVKVAV